MARRIRDSRQVFEVTLRCPEDVWGANHCKAGVFTKVKPGGHLYSHGVTSQLLGAQIILINGRPCSSLLGITASSHGPSVDMAVLLPTAEEQKQKEEELLEVAMEAEKNHVEWVARSEEKVKKARAMREDLERPYSDVAGKLFSQYPMMSSSGQCLPLRIYLQMAMQCGGDEDDCLTKLYKLADRSDWKPEVSDEDENSDVDEVVVRKRWTRRLGKSEGN